MKEILLQDCPADLREAAEKRLFLYARFINQNAVSCTEDGQFPRLSESIFTLGTLNRIIKMAPAWMGLGRPVSVNPN